MSSSLFGDILARAEKLNAATYENQISKAASDPISSSGTEGRAWFSNVNMDADIESIFKAGENLWKNSSGTGKKNLLFGEHGIVFGVSAPELETGENIVTTANDEAEIEEYVDRVKLEAERAFFNHSLVSKPQSLNTLSKRTLNNVANRSLHSTSIIDSITNRRELQFADGIRKYILSGKKKDLSAILNSVNGDHNTDGLYRDMWNEAIAMMSQKMPGDRDEASTCAFFVDNACSFLNKQFIAHMTDLVERNLEVAERGGVPGTRGLVEAFLKISPDDPQCEDGRINGLPVWEVTYHCFRAGDLRSAAEVLNQLQSFPQCACLVQALTHLSKHKRIESELKKKLKVEWRHLMHLTKDRFKRGLYCALLGGESELADTMENWLWFKLIALQTDTQITTIVFSEVQKTISLDYGEEYFMRDGQFQFYFTALWLSAQFEKAIELLANSGLVLEAVHIGILANELGYLRKTVNSASDLVVTDSSHPTRCSLNLPRLIVSFTKEFELSDPARALDYFYILKGFKTPSGSDVFEKAISRTVYLLDNRDAVNQILGYLDEAKNRKPGLIDEYVSDPCSAIESVALDTETGGNELEAIRLYLLADRPDRAVKLLCAQISEALKLGSKFDDAVLLRELVNEYGMLLCKADRKEFVTLDQLCKVVVLFDTCARNDADNALKLSKGLFIIPTHPNAVSSLVSEFHMVASRVRDIIPDMCLALMKCMVSVINRRADSRYTDQVQAIVLYAATVNCQFPVHISSEILRMQASVA